MIDGFARRYGVLPSQILQEPADLLFQILAIQPPKDPEDGASGPGPGGSPPIPYMEDYGKARMDAGMVNGSS